MQSSRSTGPMLDDAYDLREFEAGDAFRIGPLAIQSAALPHSAPNAGVRIAAGVGLAYTGDAAPDAALIDLARDANVLLAEASYVDEVPDDNRATLSSARDVGRQAAAAGVAALVLTHLLPGTDRRRARRPRARASAGRSVARAGLTVAVG